MREKLKIIALSIGCILLLRAGCAAANMQLQRSHIPKKFKIGWFYADGDCGGWLSYQGAQVFNLGAKARSALNEKGLRFFDDISEPENRENQTYFGGTWQRTPIPGAANSGDGPLENMYCAMRLSSNWPGGIPEALQKPGGYYQELGGRYLIVLPREGYVVAIASDR